MIDRSLDDIVLNCPGTGCDFDTVLWWVAAWCIISVRRDCCETSVDSKSTCWNRCLLDPSLSNGEFSHSEAMSSFSVSFSSSELKTFLYSWIIALLLTGDLYSAEFPPSEQIAMKFPEMISFSFLFSEVLLLLWGLLVLTCRPILSLHKVFFPLLISVTSPYFFFCLVISPSSQLLVTVLRSSIFWKVMKIQMQKKAQMFEVMLL